MAWKILEKLKGQKKKMDEAADKNLRELKIEPYYDTQLNEETLKGGDNMAKQEDFDEDEAEEEEDFDEDEEEPVTKRET